MYHHEMLKVLSVGASTLWVSETRRAVRLLETLHKPRATAGTWPWHNIKWMYRRSDNMRADIMKTLYR